MNKLSLKEYSDQLRRRVSAAKILGRGVIEGGNWQPAENDCHENVDVWCKHNPTFAAVKGWLYFNDPQNNRALFVAHSVVRKPDGTLADITPSSASHNYPFLEADLTDEEFDGILDQCPNHEIRCA